jgi:16S rRNA (guanine966-N2)-methyltransferase
MRIVAGSAKGRRLAVPPHGTRPTSDRAREAMFNTLRAYLEVEGAHVLDLFAGTGAVGLEALSRGAASVTFVESERAAAEVIRRNIETVALAGATLHRRPVASYLAGAGGPEPFDLVFADPPYAYGDDLFDALLATLGEPDRLALDAIVVVERSARGAEPSWPRNIAPVARRQYGGGVLWYGRHQQATRL